MFYKKTPKLSVILPYGWYNNKIMKILIIAYNFSSFGTANTKRWHTIYEDSELDLCVLCANFLGEQTTNVHCCTEKQNLIPKKNVLQKPSLTHALCRPSLAIGSIDKSIHSNFIRDAKKWIKAHKNKNFDLIIANYYPIASIIVGNWAKKIYGCGLIVDLQDLLSLHGQKLRLPILHSIDKALDKFLLRKSDAILVSSPRMEKIAKDFYKKPTHTLYNSNKYKHTSKLVIKDQKNIRILYIGTLGYGKDPSNIVALLSHYAYKNKMKIHMVFASQEDPNDFIAQKTIHLKISHFNNLNNEILQEEFELCDALLVLGDLDKNSNTNTATEVFEYLGKKPIIASCHKSSYTVEVLNNVGGGMLVQSETDFNAFLRKKYVLDLDRTSFYTTKNQMRLLKNFCGACVKKESA